jgi:quinol monooxygenase YgiN
MDKPKARFVVNSTYRIHAEDVELFADAVRPHIKITQQIPGCVFYTFSFDLLDNTLCHLAEGWADREVLQRHLESAIFQQAYSRVQDTVRILDYKGVIYTVSEEGPIVPVRQ